MHQRPKSYYRSREVNRASTKGIAYAIPLSGNKPTALPQATFRLGDEEPFSYTTDLSNADGSTLPGAQ